MLTLHLTLANNQVNIRANGVDSHSFPLTDLGQTKQEWEGFYKNPRPYGRRLFQALFRDGSESRKAFDELSRQSERGIVLVLESPDLDVIAWEYAYNKAKEEYVVEDFAFVRALPESERPANGRLKNDVDRVPLLFIPANPLVDLSGEPMRALDVEGEWREMKGHIEKSNAPFDMIELRPATPEALQSVMARFQNGMIAHFSGHGAATRDGAILLFERENGASNPLEAREFVREIKDKAWIGFLSACQSAVPERTEFSNLARELAKAGVPFAVGMQFNLPDPFAPNISGQFYNYLAHGHAVPEAARQARRAVKRENEFFVGMIALYAAHPDEVGALKWNGTGAKTLSLFHPADVSDLPSPASGLIGRQRELMRIGTRLLEGRKPLTVTLHGAGGIGKTALLWQALLRFAPSFELTLAIALDPLPSLESVLGRIERFLGLPSPCSNDTKEREALVRNALTSKRTLLGLDNFETLNYALNEEGSDEEKTAKSLHTFFKSLAANGVTLCVTSREVTNLPGETIEDIQGLSNESGGRLFQENVVRQKDEIYIEKTQQVSEMVGGHPLALRLLASAFDDQVGTSLDQYIEDLQSFLPKAHDKWTEEDRHESLRASFDFTMNNLMRMENGKTLQIALARLSVFIAFFAAEIVAPVLAGKWPETEEENNWQDNAAQRITNVLWERGLLERITLLVNNDIFYLYRLHPALSGFAAENVLSEDKIMLYKNFHHAMERLASKAYPANEGSGIFGNVFFATLVRFALPDILRSSNIRDDKEKPNLLFFAAFICDHFGDINKAITLYEDALKLYDDADDLGGTAIALSGIADIHSVRGNLEKAMSLYQQSLEINRKLNNYEGISIAIKNIAYINSMRGNIDVAINLYNQALELSDKVGNLQGRSVVLHDLANIHRDRGDLDKALSLYQESLSIKKELNDLQGKATTLNQMANVFAAQGDFDNAMIYYKQSIEIQEGLGDLHGKAITLHEIAYIHRVRGDFDEAMSLYQQSLKIKDALGDLRNKSATLVDMAYIYRVQGNLDKAMDFCGQALNTLNQLGDLQGKSVTLQEMAFIYKERGDVGKAMTLYQESLAISENLGDLKGKSTVLHNMGRIYYENGDSDRAMALYRQALQIRENLGDLQGKSATLHQMAHLHLIKNDWEKAMRIYEEALEIYNKIGDLAGKSTVLHSMANIFRKQEDFDKAMALYEQSVKIKEGLGDLRGVSASFYDMAYIHFMRGDLDMAVHLYKKSLDIDTSLGDLRSKANVLAMLGQVYIIQKDYSQGITALIESRQITLSSGARHDAEEITKILQEIRRKIGQEFDDLWSKSTNQSLPDWFSFPTDDNA